jgi:hypothetical protein
MLAAYAQTDIDARPTPGETAVYDSGSDGLDDDACAGLDDGGFGKK